MSDKPAVIYVQFQIPCSGCQLDWLQEGRLSVGDCYIPEPEMQTGYIRLVDFQGKIASITFDVTEGTVFGQFVTVEQACALVDRLWEVKQATFIPNLLKAVEISGIVSLTEGDRQDESAVVCYRLDDDGGIVEGPLYFVSGYDFYPIIERASLPRLAQMLRAVVQLAYREEMERRTAHLVILILPGEWKFN